MAVTAYLPIAGIVFGSLIMGTIQNVARIDDHDLTGIDGHMPDELHILRYCCLIQLFLLF
jgi:hypothetical protein